VVTGRIRKAGWRWQRITISPRRILGYRRQSRRGRSCRSITCRNNSRCDNNGCRRGLASLFDVEVVRIRRGCESNTAFFDSL
jgi:hypothetical protein